MTRFARAFIAALYAPFTRRRIPTSPATAIASATSPAKSSAPTPTIHACTDAASHSTGRHSARPASCSPITPRSTAAPIPTVRTGHMVIDEQLRADVARHCGVYANCVSIDIQKRATP